MTRTSPVRPAAIPLPDRATTPSFRITSASASTPRPGSMTRPPRRQRSIRPGPLDRRSRGASQWDSRPGGGGDTQAARQAANGDGVAGRRSRRPGRSCSRSQCTSRRSRGSSDRRRRRPGCARRRCRRRRCTGRRTGWRIGLHGRERARATGDHRPVVAAEELAAAADARDLGVALARAPARLGARRAAVAGRHALARAELRAHPVGRRRRTVRFGVALDAAAAAKQAERQQEKPDPFVRVGHGTVKLAIHVPMLTPLKQWSNQASAHQDSEAGTAPAPTRPLRRRPAGRAPPCAPRPRARPGRG